MTITMKGTDGIITATLVSPSPSPTHPHLTHPHHPQECHSVSRDDFLESTSDEVHNHPHAEDRDVKCLFNGD